MAVKIKVRDGHTVNFGGGVYSGGETIELSAAEAKVFVDDGRAVRVDESGKKK